MKKPTKSQSIGLAISLCVCLLVGVAWLHDRQLPLPKPIHIASAVMADGRIVTLSTESKAIQASWRLRQYDSNIEISGRKIEIGADTIATPDKVLVAIPEKAQYVELAERNGAITILVDRVEVHRF